MSEEEKKEIDVTTLTGEQLEGITDDQFNYLTIMRSKKRNPKVFEAVMSVMRPERENIIRSLSEAPFSYTSPEISLLDGAFRVKFRSLFSVQNREISKRMARSNVSEYEQTMQLQRLLLASSVQYINDSLLGEVQFPDGAHNMSTKDLEESIEKMTQKRLHAIDLRPPSFWDLIYSAYSVFITFYDGVVNIRDVDDKKSVMRQSNIIETVKK